MNRVKRAKISIVRQPIRSFILFTLFILLGSTTVGAISVHRAIEVTAVNLKRQTPAIATIIQDNDALFEYIEVTYFFEFLLNRLFFYEYLQATIGHR